MSYNEFFLEGEFIVLEMSCGDVYEGNIVNVGKNLLELVKVRQHNNPNKLQGVYTFYRAEIHKVFKLNADLIYQKEDVNNIHFTISTINKGEHDRLKEVAENYIYFENCDNRYYEAIEDLENSETVGVIPLGMERSMTTNVKLLGICTSQQVYLFDMVNVKTSSFYPELKRIFESKYICKIFHGGMAFIDILFKNYKVYTSNVFDTLIADLLLEKKKQGKPPKKARLLPDCLELYVKLPASILRHSKKIPSQHWSERPLDNHKKLYASQLCTYIFKLHQIMKSIMLKNVFATTESFYNYVQNLGESEFEMYTKSNKIPDVLNEWIPVPVKQVVNGNCNLSKSSDI